MPNRTGPDVFFSFPGVHGSVSQYYLIKDQNYEVSFTKYFTFTIIFRPLFCLLCQNGLMKTDLPLQRGLDWIL